MGKVAGIKMPKEILVLVFREAGYLDAERKHLRKWVPSLTSYIMGIKAKLASIELWSEVGAAYPQTLDGEKWGIEGGMLLPLPHANPPMAGVPLARKPRKPRVAKPVAPAAPAKIATDNPFGE